MKHAPALIALLALAACGREGPAENRADQLEEAAEQSTPAAEDVLENAADRIEEGVPNPDQAAQQALNAAANAQEHAWPPPGTSQPVDDPDSD